MSDGKVEIDINMNDDQAQSTFQRLKGLLTGTSNEATKTGGVFKQMLGANVIGNALSDALRGITNGVRSMAGELNSSKKAWDTFEGNMRMLGNSDAEINKAKKAMQDYATQTIYSASDMASTYSQLAAVGVENVDQLVTGFGGLAASAENPAQAMKSLSMQATQMAAKPTVAWQDFKIMMEQSPAGMAAVAEAMGMSLEEMIGKIQNGELATQDFFNAVKEVGNNDHFSKMATQFKTVDQAIDGLKESLANKLQPAFSRLTEFGIKAVEKLSGVIDKMDFSKLEQAVVRAGRGISDFFSGLSSSGAFEALKRTFDSVGKAISNILSSLTGETKVSMEGLGTTIGDLVEKLANVVTKVADFIAKLDPAVISTFATSVLAVVAAIKTLSVINQIKGFFSGFGSTAKSVMGGVSNAATGSGEIISQVFKGIGEVITSVSEGLATVIKGVGEAASTAAQGIGTGLATAFKGLGMAIAMVPPTTWLALGAAILMVGGAIALVATQSEGVSQILQAVGNTVQTVIQAIVAGAVGLIPVIQQIGQSVSQVVISIGIAVAQMAPTVRALGDAIESAFNGMASVVSSVGEAISSSLNSLGEAFRGLGEGIGTALDGVANVIESFGSGVKLALEGVGTVFESMSSGIEKVMNGIATIIDSVGSAISKVIDSITDGFTKAGEAAVNAGTGFDKIAAAIQSLVGLNVLDLAATLAAVGKGLKDIGKASEGLTAVATALGTLTPALSTLTSALSGVNPALTSFRTAFTTAFNGIGQTVTSSMASAQASVVAGMGAIRSAFTSGLESLKSATTSSFNTIKSTATNNMNAMKSSLVSSVNAMRSNMTSGLNQMKSSAINIMNSMVSSMQSIGMRGVGVMRNVGYQIGNGLAEGMNSALGVVRAAANALVAEAERAARAKAQIHSPSRLFRDQVGRYIAEGLGVGISQNADSVTSSFDEVNSQLQAYQFDDKSIFTYLKGKMGEFGVQANFGASGGLNPSLQELINLMRSYVGRPVVLEAEGRQIGTLVTPYVNENNKRQDRFNKRKRGEVD